MAKPSITVQIILPEDTSAIKSTQKPAVRHCGDEILGYIEVMTCGTFGFNIEVAFEGWLCSSIPFVIEITKTESRPRPDLDWFRK